MRLAGTPAFTITLFTAWEMAMTRATFGRTACMIGGEDCRSRQCQITGTRATRVAAQAAQRHVVEPEPRLARLEEVGPNQGVADMLEWVQRAIKAAPAGRDGGQHV